MEKIVIDNEMNSCEPIGRLKIMQLDSPLGHMVSIADESALYLLEFGERRNLQREIERLQQRMNASIISGLNAPLESIEKELTLYFAGKLSEFKTPLKYFGSPFQQRVWEQLRKIPYGQTCSYLDLAKAVGNPAACRAVARANSMNQLAIIIPCHRVINHNGKLGGYAGGLERKQWLIDLEGNHT
jgi:AraC family transcriptional regulator, regulatory protein of adaptative response / methylated-DNA-[protein]-cysteine methyltransferase